MMIYLIETFVIIPIRDLSIQLLENLKNVVINLIRKKSKLSTWLSRSKFDVDIIAPETVIYRIDTCWFTHRGIHFNYAAVRFYCSLNLWWIIDEFTYKLNLSLNISFKIKNFNYKLHCSSWIIFLWSDPSANYRFMHGNY